MAGIGSWYSSLMDLLVRCAHIFLIYDVGFDPKSQNPGRGLSGSGNGKAPSQRASSHLETHKPTKVTKSRAGRGNGSARHNGGNNSITTGKARRRGAPTGDERLFACPFFKFNPIKHMDCLLRNSLTETSFVVQHLLRGHSKQPIHCPVCGETFSMRDDCNSHIQEQSCQRQRFQHEGLTEDQLSDLKQPRRHMNEVDRWYSIWKILYKDTPRPESPYVLEPPEEIAGIVRRALQHAHALRAPRDIGSVSLSELQVTSQGSHNAFEPAGLDEAGTMVPTIGLSQVSWAYVLSIIPHRHDLSYLTSDRSAQPSEQFQPVMPPTLRDFTQTSQATAEITTSDGSAALDDIGSGPFHSYAGDMDLSLAGSPQSSFVFDLEAPVTQTTDPSSILPGPGPSSASISVETGCENETDSHLLTRSSREGL